jgi:hypothetical protein
MPLISNIGFNVKYDLTGTPSLVLTDTTTAPPTGMVGIFEITQPDGFTRTGDIFSPDLSAGGAFTFPLTLDENGEVQKGTYVIKLTAAAPGYLSTDFTRTFEFSYEAPSLELREEFDVFTPSLVYHDDTDYSVDGYDAGTVTRLWTGTSIPTGAIGSSWSTLDLLFSLAYYDALYTIELLSTITYTHQTLSWLTVDEAVSETVDTYAETPPTFEEIVALIAALKAALDEAINNCLEYGQLKADFEYAQTLLWHIVDKFRTNQLTGVDDVLKDLIKVLHNHQIPTYVATNLPIPPYDFGFLSGGGSGSWGTITGSISSQTDLWNIIQNLYLKDHYTHDQSVASATWTVTHNMGKYPSVTVVDTAGDEVFGDVNYVSVNQLVISFNAPFSGKAYLN